MIEEEEKPYFAVSDLPNRYGVTALANRMDSADQPLRREWEVREDAIAVGDRLPKEATRFVAAVRWLDQLEDRTEIDPVPVLELLWEVGRRSPGPGPTFETADVVRALERERALMRSNADSDRPGGRPSKVDQLAEEIDTTVCLSADGRFEREEDTEVRDRLIREQLWKANISRSTYYRLRRRVLDEHDLDLSDLDGLPSQLGF